MQIEIQFGNIKTKGVVIAYKAEFNKFNALISLGLKNISLLKSIFYKSRKISPLDINYTTFFHKNDISIYHARMEIVFKQKIILFNKFSYIWLIEIPNDIIEDPFCDLEFEFIGISYYQRYFFSTNLQDRVTSVIISPGEYEFSYQYLEKIASEKNILLNKSRVIYNKGDIFFSHIRLVIEKIFSHFAKIKYITLEVPFLIDEDWNVSYIYKDISTNNILKKSQSSSFPSTPSLSTLIDIISILKKQYKFQEINIRFKFYYIHQDKQDIDLSSFFSNININLNDSIEHIVQNIVIPKDSIIDKTQFITDLTNIFKYYIEGLNDIKDDISHFIIGDLNIYCHKLMILLYALMSRFRNLYLEAYHLESICIYHKLIKLNKYIYWSGIDQNGYDNKFIYQFLLKASIYFKKTVVISSLRTNANLYYSYKDNNIEKLEENFIFWNAVSFVESITLYSFISINVLFANQNFVETRSKNNIQYNAILWDSTSALNDKLIHSRLRDLFYVYFQNQKVRIFGFEETINSRSYNIDSLEEEIYKLSEKAIILSHHKILYIFEIDYIKLYYKKLNIIQKNLLKNYMSKHYIIIHNKLFTNYKLTIATSLNIHNSLKKEYKYTEFCQQEYNYLITDNKYLLAINDETYLKINDECLLYKKNAEFIVNGMNKIYDYIITTTQYNKEYIYVYSIKFKKPIFGFLINKYRNEYIYIMTNKIYHNDYLIKVIRNDLVKITNETKIFILSS